MVMFIKLQHKFSALKNTVGVLCLVLVLLSTRVKVSDFFYSGIQLYLLSNPYFVLSLFYISICIY